MDALSSGRDRVMAALVGAGPLGLPFAELQRAAGFADRQPLELLLGNLRRGGKARLCGRRWAARGSAVVCEVAAEVCEVAAEVCEVAAEVCEVAAEVCDVAAERAVMSVAVGVDSLRAVELARIDNMIGWYLQQVDVLQRRRDELLEVVL